MHYKKVNARIQKWRLMIRQGVHKDPQLLKSRIRKGIPPAIRSLAWPEIINMKKFAKTKENSYTYSKLINTPSSSIYQISLDIPRTFPEEQDSQILRKSLNNVLKAISIVYPKVGYCQGMNFLALRLLQVMDDEDTFWLLHLLLEKDPHIMKNFIEPRRIEEQSAVFWDLIKFYLPRIWNKFQTLNLSPNMFTVRWFMTLFSSVLKQQIFYRIFQIFLYEGWRVIYATGIVFFKTNEEQLLSNSFQNTILLLNSQIYHITNTDAFVQEVCSIEIQQNMLQELTEKVNRSAVLRSSRGESLARVERQNNYKLPQPQTEPQGQLLFQRQSEEVTFQSFILIGKKRQ